MDTAKFIIAFSLFIVVALILVFFLRHGRAVQQKHFLVSGMFFLLFTGISGVIYIVLTLFPAVYSTCGRLFLNGHRYIALHSWCLSGMLVLIPWNDFPLRVNSTWVIGLHWIPLGLVAPLVRINLGMALFTIVLYMYFLSQFFQKD